MTTGGWNTRGQMHRHGRFAIALVAGVLMAVVLPVPLTGRVLVGADMFFVLYLGLTALHIHGLTPAQIRHNVSADDEGGHLIFLLALAIVALSVLSVVGMMTGAVDDMRFGTPLAVAAVPLGWATLHTIMAFRYADLFYDPGEDRPLDFPGTETLPGIWDFLYFSFTLGVAAQTADVVVRSGRMRKLVILHCILTFFYNTVLLALAVNAAVSLGNS